MSKNTRDQRTSVLKPADVSREWILVDASEVPLGRLATFIASRLTGKYQAKYTPHVDSGDFVVVINSDKLIVTGRKEEQKTYYHHSKYPGGLKETKLSDQREKDSTKVIELAVKGMLPKNKLQPLRMKRLKVYSGEEHSNGAQKPKKVGVK